MSILDGGMGARFNLTDSEKKKGKWFGKFSPSLFTYPLTWNGSIWWFMTDIDRREFKQIMEAGFDAARKIGTGS